jgi:hypothetical protein
LFEVGSDSDDDDGAAVVVFVEGGLVPRGVPDRDTDLELVVDMCDLFYDSPDVNELVMMLTR